VISIPAVPYLAGICAAVRKGHGVVCAEQHVDGVIAEFGELRTRGFGSDQVSFPIRDFFERASRYEMCLQLAQMLGPLRFLFWKVLSALSGQFHFHFDGTPQVLRTGCALIPIGPASNKTVTRTAHRVVERTCVQTGA